MRHKALTLTMACLSVCAGAALAADPPQVEISSPYIKAKLYLPDAQNGFYRATRFDWSGVISSLEYHGHNFYGPWFSQYDPSVRDFIYKDSDIVAGAASAMTGPADEFQKPLGYDTAKAGGTFVKIGVGVLRKADEESYASFKKFEIVDPGKWSIRKGRDYVEFTQVLNDPATGYGYTYRKTVRLASGQPEMTIEHSLKNTGRLPIRSNVYNHNFLVLDKSGPGPDMVTTLTFDIKSPRPPAPEMAEINGKRILYKKSLENQERVFFPIQGFSENPRDYDIRIEDKKAGVGMRITGDRPLASETLWSIRSVMSIEPFVDVPVDPGKEFDWKYTYTYYTLPGRN
jgi:hypothetical protein